MRNGEKHRSTAGAHTRANDGFCLHQNQRDIISKWFLIRKCYFKIFYKYNMNIAGIFPVH